MLLSGNVFRRASSPRPAQVRVPACAKSSAARLLCRAIPKAAGAEVGHCAAAVLDAPWCAGLAPRVTNPGRDVSAAYTGRTRFSWVCFIVPHVAFFPWLVKLLSVLSSCALSSRSAIYMWRSSMFFLLRQAMPASSPPALPRLEFAPRRASYLAFCLVT